jgi:glycosyltransferase involved in cell wall biosynthesis
MTGRGALSADIEALGVSLFHLNMKRGGASPGALLRLAGIIRKTRPDVVQTWLYHADLMGLLAARLARTGKVVWNLRCSDMDLSKYRRMTSFVLKANAFFSTRPEAIVSNSHRAVELHRGFGYRPRRIEVIPNGFDLERYRPDPGAGARLRQKLGIPADAPVVGMVARLDPMKGHDVFGKVWRSIRSRLSYSHAVLVGKGVEKQNAGFTTIMREAGLDLDERVHLLGERADIDRLMNTFNVLAVPSYTEGFPNVVGEAMASGVPCVVTDVGDSAFVVGDTGRVAPPGDAQAFAAELEAVLTMPPEALSFMGRSARKRVEEHFSMPAVAGQYQNLYTSLA